MKIHLKNIFFFTLCLFLTQETFLHAYSPDAATQIQADSLVHQIHKKMDSFRPARAARLKSSIYARLIEMQNGLIHKSDNASLQKNALYEIVRRQLFPDSFDTSEALFDDGAGAIWNHASKGFNILYNPISTPTIGALSSGTKNILINGSYFSRQETTQYHSGLLGLDHLLWSEMVYGDSQITHIVCLDSHRNITFLPNSSYHEKLFDVCDIVFQAGPMIYSLLDGIVTEDFFPRSYIGRAHNRTVMVLFEKSGKQDLWFLTLIKPTTLADVRNIVLRESRFRGEYDTLTIFNLDGGSSVAHRNPDHPELNFGSNKALPVVFEIYK